MDLRALLPFVLCILVGVAPLRAEEHLTYPHVYQELRGVAQDVELVREVMGRPKVTASPWEVLEAEPRHVYSQVQTILRDVNQLSLQLTGEAQPMPTAPEEVIEIGHLHELVTASRAGLDRIRNKLEIGYRAEPNGLEDGRGPEDIMSEAVQVDRQLELMLDRPISSEDVYDRLKVAASYVAGVLTTDPDKPVYGTLPLFEPHKMPSDVYRRVLECLAIAQAIDREYGIPVLQINLRPELIRDDIHSSDVFHLATTVLVELANLTLTLEGEYVDLPPIERPEHIFPSHAYQMAGLLQEQLSKLEAKLEEERNGG